MGNIIKNMNLFEGVSYELPKVYCKDRNESVEFEDILHKNGYTFRNRAIYLIKNNLSIQEVTFHDINMMSKTFGGRSRKDPYHEGMMIDYSSNKLILKDILQNPTEGLFRRLLSKPPTYKPKKIDKTLESTETPISDVYRKKLSYSKYNPLVVRISDQEDKDYFFNLVGWYDIFPSYDLEDYPIGTDYILTLKDGTLGIDAFRIGYADDYTYYDSGDLEKYNPNIYPKLLTPGDLYYVLKDLLGVPDAKSMYSPKKKDYSIDEGVSYWPYRFKTEEEFIKEYGRGWQGRIQEVNRDENVGVGWASPDMDNLLGQPCQIEGIDMTTNQRYHLPTDKISRGYWFITNEMLIKNRQTEPSYIPRKIDRTIESTDNYMYNRVVFRVNNAIENIRAQESLFKLGYSWSVNGYDVVGFSDYPHYIFTPSIYDRRKNITHMYFEQYEFNKTNIDEYISKKNREDRDNICPKVFSYNDVPHIDTILKHGRIVPSYAPKKIERTLESLKPQGYKYDGLVVKVNNKDEIKEVIDYFYKKYNIENDQNLEELIDTFNLMYNAHFNNHIIVLLDDEEFMMVSDRMIQKYIGAFELNPTIYTIDDLKNFNRNLEIGPSYKPRKMDRTLEGLSEYPYRFKTEDEMIRDYGNNWRTSDAFGGIGWSDINFDGSSYMDIYLGQTLPFKEEEFNDRSNYKALPNRYNSWAIHWNMLTPNIRAIKKPDYSPRKIDRTLESRNIDKSDKYNHIVIKIDSLSDFRKAQRELLNQNYVWITDSMNVQDSARNEDYPLYIFINGDYARYYKRKFFYECTSLLDEGSIERTILHRQEGSEKEEICPKIFDINNINNVNRLFNYISAPTYQPKKIDRTLESVSVGKYYNNKLGQNTDWPYRFKTKDEFDRTCEKLYDDWKCGRYLFVDEMKFLFGRTLEYNYPEDEEYIEVDYNQRQWYVTKQMLVKNGLSTPNYNPRKINRDI